MAKQPDLNFLIAHPAHFFALGCGSGLAPKAPGTFGTLFAWAMFALFHHHFSDFGLFFLLTVAIRPEASDIEGWTLMFGILLIAGGFIPFITGMLYKIVPFLSWMHLQNCGQAKVPAPAMNKILAEPAMHRQMLAYGVALILLLAAIFIPAWLARPAGLAFAVANGWLFWNLAGAIRRYRQHFAEIEAKLAARLATP